MGNNHDYIALDWVKGEIKQTLSQAQIALEAFVENKNDTPQITFCLNHIHQVHGTLQMVEFYGAALLAEEMEKLCQALIEDKVASVQEAQEVLMDSLLQLENYLEHIQKGQRDLPVVLLPILNDLRALQGQPLLSDTSLFTPDLSAATVTPDIAHNLRMQDEQVIANLRKLRQMFQFSFAGIIRNQDLDDNFSYLYKVVSRLEKFCQGTPIGKIWWVAVGFLDAIQGEQESLSSATKQLLRELDHQIKLMIDEQQTILAKPLPADLLKNLLYYVAKSKTPSKRIEKLKADFSLSQALPSEQEVDAEREKLHRPGEETMSSVVEVLSEELSLVKEQLDLYVRGDEKDNSTLADLTPQLSQIANTMAVLGLGVARKLVLEQITRIEDIVDSNQPASDQVLMDMAGALLYVEANLSTLKDSDSIDQSENEDGEFVVPAEHFESAHNAVIYESRNGLEQAKNSIVNFIASQWDHAEIEDVPDLLDSIRGGLQIIPLTQAANLLESCSTYIRNSLLSDKHIPDWQQLDRLADAITSIEYYMERLSEGAHDNERILKVAEESVAKLGFPTHESNENNIPVLSQHHVSDVASESPDSIEKESDQGLIDEDILEIFMEEVAEVMDEIQVAMAQLRTNPEDLSALQNLRRAFHTLKGSGRLVGAKVISEIAWPIENLLNKHLDASQSLEMEVFDLLDSVIEKLPVLTEDFSAQRESSHYEHLIARADMLSGNETRVVHKTMHPGKVSEPSTEQLDENPAIDPRPVAPTETEVSDVEPEVTVAEQTVESAEIEDSWDDDEDDLIDEEILEIFIEEAGEVLEAIDTHLPVYLNAHDDQDALKELRRAFHTLKGSGRMVNANIIGEAAWSIENLLNRIIDGSVLMNDSIAELIQLVVQNIPQLIECFEKRQRPDFNLKLVESQAEALQAGDLVKPISSLSRKSETEAPKEIQEEQSSSAIAIDDTLLDIFKNEAAAHVASVEEFIAEARQSNGTAIDDDLSRALHTLKGSANTANIKPIASIAVPVEQFIKEARANNIDVNAEVAEMLSTAMQFIRDGIDQLSNSPNESLSGTAEFLDQLKELQSQVFTSQEEDLQTLEDGSRDPQIINIFLTEGLDILLDAESILNQWEHSPVSVKELTKLYGEVKTLHRGAKVAGLDNIAELCDCLESCYGSLDIETDRPSSVFINDIKRGHEALIDMMDQLAAGLTLNLDNKLLAELREHVADHSHVETETEHTLNDKLDELEKELDDVLPSYSHAEEEHDELEQNTFESADTDDSDEDIMDADLAEIFLEEANELVEGIAPALGKLKDQPGNEHILLQLQRDLHTLKGGARMAGFKAIGDLADVLEKLFEKLIDYKSEASSLIMSLLEESADALTAMLESIKALQPCTPQDNLIGNINEIIKGLTTHTPLVEEDEPTHNENISANTSERDSNTSEALLDLDPELAEIFLEEAQEIIDSSGELLHQWESDVYNIELVAELQRELHTLKGGARMAEINAIGDLAHELETLFESIVNKQLDASQEITSLCLSCHDALASMVDAVHQGNAIPTSDQLLETVKRVTSGDAIESTASEPEAAPVAPEPAQTEELITDAAEEAPSSPGTVLSEDDLEADLLPLFIDESKDILSAAAEYLEHWREDEDGIEGIVELQREMHTLKGGARLADVDSIGDLAEAVNTRLEQMIDGQLNDPQGLYLACAKAYQELTEMLESLIHGETIKPAPALIQEVNQAGVTSEASVAQSEPEQPASLSSLLSGDVDLEVLELFVEEARELIEALEEQISLWSKTPSEEAPNLEIQRILHTLKGGARLSNLNKLADESHELESRLLQAQESKESFDGAFKETVVASQDVLLKLVDELEAIAGGENTPSPAAPVPEAKPSQSPTSEPNLASEPKKAQEKAPAKAAEPIKAVQKVAPQETIRVSAGLLDSLVNLAGETSISRGRLEQQISDFGFTLEEMSATIERLREQLRRMDMETEAQVLFRAEKEGLKAPNYEDFDPLEMDRYSSIQQLSRALSESTSDLQDLRDTLSDRSRDAETLLLQQSRINSELQEGLMKTRMIPFSSIVPRLRRIVRQIGSELNKQVDFDALNAEGEMDRSVLERMVAPLEHMLRNALDHGIETAADRKKSGKPASGKITLSLMREGGNIVLKMKDDGAGINDKAVLSKAIKQGLVDKNSAPSRHEVMQFIMLQGFSTAEKVTQISGRGVGMDVVASEIKQMGGSIEIDSEFGQGTEFTIRLPFTVSVNRALMVNIGEDFYAIPLNTIEGIVRVSPYELEEYYKPDAPLYEYADREYQLQYLGKLLHSHHHPKLQGQPLPLPVILVRGSDKPMALQVDSLMGSREIVVKSLGPQFANVHGASGATILGDGSVVVILDLPALIRDDMAGILDSIDPGEVIQTQQKQTSTVMVVDDSVTVRKVTTRLLERNGYEVLTAKDGVDAIALLQDHKPDIMLLDIEMPRMDGFEVATLVRHDERLQDVPIIMITSRTGTKHKERALSIGVNEYLGKPFQEHDLLENIERFIG